MNCRRFARTCLWNFLAICFAFGSPPASDSLREAASRSGILIGAAVRPAHLSEPAYAATLAREFNMLEPEDSLKWEVLRPTSQAFDFSQADQIVDFAIRHNMKVRGHTLVWHRQNPAWLENGHFSSEQLSKLLETHIKTVVGRYHGKIFAWDVANEAFDEGKNAGKLRSTIWYDKSGIDKPGIGDPRQTWAYLAQCFRWAHEADPKALLFYNEAEAEIVNAKSDAIYSMVSAFKREGVPIDGVGFQMHIGDLSPDISSISRNIARFTELGVQVQITEMDVSLPVDSNGNAKPEDLQRQAEIYRAIADACLSHPGCTAIQTWGFTDKYSWIGSHSKKTRGAALLFDANYCPKPAYEALRQAISARR
jgi:endo-1,4-beta-xylanase